MSGEVKVCGERGLVAWCGSCQEWEAITLTNITRMDPKHGRIPTGDQAVFCRTCGTPHPAIPRYGKAAGHVEQDAAARWCRSGHPLVGGMGTDDCGQVWCDGCQAHVTPRTEAPDQPPTNSPDKGRSDALKLLHMVRSRVAYVRDGNQTISALGPAVGWLEEAMYLLTGTWPEKPTVLKAQATKVDGLCSHQASCFSAVCRMERYAMFGTTEMARCPAGHVTRLVDGIKMHRDLRPEA